jgi:hypothetical protein
MTHNAEYITQQGKPQIGSKASPPARLLVIGGLLAVYLAVAMVSGHQHSISNPGIGELLVTIGILIAIFYRNMQWTLGPRVLAIESTDMLGSHYLTIRPADFAKVEVEIVKDEDTGTETYFVKVTTRLGQTSRIKLRDQPAAEALKARVLTTLA